MYKRIKISYRTRSPTEGERCMSKELALVKGLVPISVIRGVGVTKPGDGLEKEDFL